MRLFGNVRVSAWRWLSCCLAASLALAVSAAPEVSGTDTPSRPGVAQKRHPLVVQKQAEISGRVFFLPDEGEGSSVAAKQLEISVHNRDGSKVLHKTITDDDGQFVLPDLGEGIYQIRLGGLILDLHVLARANDGKKSIPKSLLVFMPRDLEK